MTPNILTGPCVKGVNKPYIHLPDEYDRLRMLQKVNRISHIISKKLINIMQSWVKNLVSKLILMVTKLF
jgi:hypothetical protein